MAKSRSAKRNIGELFLLENNRQAMIEGPQKKHWSKHDIKSVKPLTDNQNEMFKAYFEGSQVCAYGTAGSGKTFLSIYLAMCDILDGNRDQDHLIIVRSAVATRDVGFLPGTLEEKMTVYERPYRELLAELFGRMTTYDDMKAVGLVQFMPTSYVRGLTWDNAVVIIDEIQNMTLDEIDSVLTRIGQNTRVILCGDQKYQCDLKKEKTCINDLLTIIGQMRKFNAVRFTKEDIIRSGFVREWIEAREFAKI